MRSIGFGDLHAILARPRFVRVPSPFRSLEGVDRLCVRGGTPSRQSDLATPPLPPEASYEPSAAEAFGNLLSSPLYLSPAFLKAEPSSMNFRC